MNQVHNIPIEDLIQALKMLQEFGYSYTDIIIASPSDIAFFPSQMQEAIVKLPLKDIDLKHLT